MTISGLVDGIIDYTYDVSLQHSGNAECGAPYLSHETLVPLLTHRVAQAQLSVQKPASQGFAAARRLPPVVGAKHAGLHQFPTLVARDLGKTVGTGDVSDVPGEVATLAIFIIDHGRVEILPPEQGQKLALGQKRAPWTAWK